MWPGLPVKETRKIGAWRLRDKFLLFGWVFSYAVILLIFKILRRMEADGSRST